MAKVKKISHTGGKRLDKLLKQGLKGSVDGIDVGFFRSARYQDGTPVATVAAVNEFGSSDGRIPERSFFRNAIKTSPKKLTNTILRNIDPERMIIDGTLAGKLGAQMQDELQQSITDLRTPPNAPGTIKEKGSSNPLVDTGLMRQSVTFKVDT